MPEISTDTLPLTAHPYSDEPCPHAVKKPVTLVVGPEGGFIPYEIEMLKSVGFKTVSLGERILRVEDAVTTLIGRLF